MAKITRVKAAQQRYRTVPVIDPETNEPKRTLVTRKDGSAKLTRRGGREIWRTVTVEDRTQPLPPYTCDHCSKPIEIGTPYKHITPKSGPYGGRKRTRHASCPDWNVWDYSSSLNARTAQISFEFGRAIDQAESEDDVQSALDDAASSVRELAEEKRESAQNIEDGFGHATSQSEELSELADQLDDWANEIESATIPDFPEPEEEDCGAEGCSNGEVQCEGCEGTGIDPDDEDEACEDCKGRGSVSCEECGGNGTIQGEEPTEDQLDEWRQEVAGDLTVVDECPV